MQHTEAETQDAGRRAQVAGSKTHVLLVVVVVVVLWTQDADSETQAQ